jgi:hypothetical protein
VNGVEGGQAGEREGHPEFPAHHPHPSRHHHTTHPYPSRLGWGTERWTPALCTPSTHIPPAPPGVLQHGAGGRAACDPNPIAASPVLKP